MKNFTNKIIKKLYCLNCFKNRIYIYTGFGFMHFCIDFSMKLTHSSALCGFKTGGLLTHTISTHFV